LHCLMNIYIELHQILFSSNQQQLAAKNLKIIII